MARRGRQHVKHGGARQRSVNVETLCRAHTMRACSIRVPSGEVARDVFRGVARRILGQLEADSHIRRLRPAFRPRRKD